MLVRWSFTSLFVTFCQIKRKQSLVPPNVWKQKQKQLAISSCGRSTSKILQQLMTTTKHIYLENQLLIVCLIVFYWSCIRRSFRCLFFIGANVFLVPNHGPILCIHVFPLNIIISLSLLGRKVQIVTAVFSIYIYEFFKLKLTNP